MQIKPIRTPDDHAQALGEITRLWAAEPGTDDGDRFDVLATLVEAYERKTWPMDRLDPIDTIKAHMELNGLTQGDLEALLGSQPRASELLNRRRRLTLDQIRRFEREWKLPASLLIA
jgi:HTH-type transcriptional regulator/antitoxin HigA